MNPADDAFDARMSQLLAEPPDLGDLSLNRSVGELLRGVRTNLGMEVVFLSEFVDGRRVFRRVDTAPDQRVIEEGMSHALEDSFCQRVIDGRLQAITPDVDAVRATQDLPTYPFNIGSYIGVPVQLRDGRIYGTLCAFSATPKHDLSADHLRRLEMSARFAAKIIEGRQAAARTDAS